MALALALMFVRSLTQGAQVLLLVPLMQLLGLNVQQGSIGWLAEFVSSIFAATGIRPMLVTVLGAFLLFTIALALVIRWQTIFNFKLEQDFVAHLRRRLYRAIAGTNWLTFCRSRVSDFTHALTIELDRVGVATAFLLQLFTNVALLAAYVLFVLQVSAAMTVLVLPPASLCCLYSGKGANDTVDRRRYLTGDQWPVLCDDRASWRHEDDKSYGVEERNADLFSKLADEVTRMRLNVTRNYAETALWFTLGSVVRMKTVSEVR